MRSLGMLLIAFALLLSACAAPKPAPTTGGARTLTIELDEFSFKPDRLEL